MENKDIYLLLDKTLRLINDGFPEFVEFSTINTKLYKSIGNSPEFSKRQELVKKSLIELMQIVGYLQKNGFIIFKTEMNNNNEFKNYKKLKITIEGIIFLNKGGFRKQYEIDNTKFQRDIDLLKRSHYKDWVLILGTIVSWVIAILAIVFK